MLTASLERGYKHLASKEGFAKRVSRKYPIYALDLADVVLRFYRIDPRAPSLRAQVSFSIARDLGD